MRSCQSSPRCPSLSCPCAFARAFVQLSARAALLLTSGSRKALPILEDPDEMLKVGLLCDPRVLCIQRWFKTGRGTWYSG